MLKSKESELASLISEKKALESSIEDLETALQTAEASLKATKIDLVKKKKSDERDGAELEKLRESKVDSELKIKQLEKALKEEKMSGRSRIQEADASIADLKVSFTSFSHYMPHSSLHFRATVDVNGTYLELCTDSTE